MSLGESVRHAWLRWDRAGVAVRCGWRAARPGALREYLVAAHEMLACGAPEVPLLQHMLRLLLQTVDDIALPRPWRELCLAQAVDLQGRLAQLLDFHDPVAAQALEMAVHEAERRFVGPGTQR